MPILLNKEPEQDWHAIYTRHQHEKTVAQILSYKGFDVFLPLYPAVHRWKDRDKQLSLPLFPCYVFLNGGMERRLDIVTTPGMYSFVGTERGATAIPTAEIDAIRRAVESSVRVEPHPFLKCGDRVRVKSGPLQGVEGFVWPAALSARGSDVTSARQSVQLSYGLPPGGVGEMGWCGIHAVRGRSCVFRERGV